MSPEVLHTQQELELLPEYYSSEITFITVRKMSIDFLDENGQKFGLKKLKKAFHYLKRSKINFVFNSPEDILEKYKLESGL
jgi:hypothetical protein